MRHDVPPHPGCPAFVTAKERFHAHLRPEDVAASMGAEGGARVELDELTPGRSSARDEDALVAEVHAHFEFGAERLR